MEASGADGVKLSVGDMTVTDVQIHGDIVYVSSGVIVRRFETATGAELPRPKGPVMVPRGEVEVARESVSVCSGQEIVTWKGDELVHHVIFGKNDQVQSCALSPDGRQQIVGMAADVDMGGYYSNRPTYSPQVYVYKLGDSEPTTILEAGELVRDVSSTGSVVRAFVGWDRVAAFEVPGQERLASAESTTGALSPGGRYGISMPEKRGSYGLTYTEGLTIVDFESGNQHSIELDGDIVTQEFGFSPNGEWPATPAEGQIRLVELATGDTTDIELPALRVFDRDQSPYRKLVAAASNDGRRVAVGWGRRIHVFDSNGKELATWWTGDSKVRGISFDEKGDIFTLLNSAVVLRYEAP